MMPERNSEERQWLLALDTSTDWAGVALTDGTSLAEINWSAGRHQTTQVMPEVQRLLETAGIGASSLGAIAVAVGPGSFSGLRVGMAIANGFAVAQDVPVIGVSTLKLTVHGWASREGPAVGVIRAGRSRYGWAIDKDIDSPVTGVLDELVDYIRLRDARVVVGELTEADTLRIGELSRAIVPPYPNRMRRAASLARIGWERWRMEDYAPDAILEPVYLHRQ